MKTPFEVAQIYGIMKQLNLGSSLPTAVHFGSTHEIALHVMASRSLNTADKPLPRIVRKRVGAGLRHYRKLGLIRSIVGPNQTMLWEMVR
jgi:hypothetical protein